MKNVQQVNQYLADLSVWNVKLHNLHFNVTGPQFKSIHEYLESIYDEAFEYFDISKCDLIAYSNGNYYSLGKKIGRFGFSVQKNKKKKKK